MKVAQISAVFPPYKGGIGQVAYHYAEELSNLGCEVTVFTPDYGKKSQFDKLDVRYLRPLFKWGKAGFCPQLFFHLAEFDVLQIHFPAFGLAEVVAWWKWWRGRKKAKLFIFYHHDVVGEGKLGSFFDWYKRKIMPFILRQADKILVSSFDYARHSDLAKFFPAWEEKSIELPFGVSESFVPGERQRDILQKYGIPLSDKIILFVGGLDRNHYFKGVNILLSAVAQLSFSDWRLVIVGEGDLRSHYEKQAQDLNIADQVIFVGRQPDEVLPDFYRAADVVVLPSTDRSEAFGLVLIEAMACGAPVIASNLVGVRSVVEDGKTGFLVQPRDVGSLVKALESLLKDEKLRQDMSQQAAAAVVERYQWHKIGERLLELYSLYL